MPDFEKLLMFGVTKPGLSADDLRRLAKREEISALLEKAKIRLSALGALMETDDFTDAAVLLAPLTEDLAAAAGRLYDEPGLAGNPRDPDALAFLQAPEPRRILERLFSLSASAVFAREQAREALRQGERAVALMERAYADTLRGALYMPLDGYERRKTGRLHLFLASIALFVCAAILTWDQVAALRRARAVEFLETAKEEQARETLEELAALAYAAKASRLVPLTVVTGQECSWCGCEDRDLQSLVEGDACRRKWENALTAILTANGRAPEARFFADPWGAPYLLNENEKEQPGECVKDVIVSAGRDGRLGTADDVRVIIDNALCKN